MTAYNTVSKISRRTLNDIEDIEIDLLEKSLTASAVKALAITNTTTFSNKYEKLILRKNNELFGLNYATLMDSYRLMNVKVLGNVINDITKSYSNKIKLLDVYTNKLKY